MAEYTIYVVGSGSYSDAQDICGFTTRELAQEYIDSLLAVEYVQETSRALEVIKQRSSQLNSWQVNWANSLLLQYPTAQEFIKKAPHDYWIKPLEIWDILPVAKKYYK